MGTLTSKAQSRAVVATATRFDVFRMLFFTQYDHCEQWLEEYDEVWEKRVRLGKGAAAREPDKVLFTSSFHFGLLNEVQQF